MSKEIKRGWRERLVKELEELSGRIDKLDSFIKSENFLKLERADRALLEIQMGVMENYRRILLLRLANSRSSFDRVYFPLNIDKLE